MAVRYQSLALASRMARRTAEDLWLPDIVHDDDVAWAQDRGELLLDISAKAFAIDRPVEDAGRGETVAAQCAQERQRAPMAVRARPGRRFPLGPQPRNGAMLVLIQVSSMKTRRSGSMRPCQERHRRRRRATSSRLCSSANRVFFERQPFAAQEQPYGVVRDLDAARRQFVLRAVQRQMRRLCNSLDDESPVRPQGRLAMTAHLARRDRSRRPLTLRPLHHRRNGDAETRATDRSSRPPSPPPPRAHEDHWKAVAPSMLASCQPAS